MPQSADGRQVEIRIGKEEIGIVGAGWREHVAGRGIALRGILPIRRAGSTARIIGRLVPFIFRRQVIGGSRVASHGREGRVGVRAVQRVGSRLGRAGALGAARRLTVLQPVAEAGGIAPRDIVHGEVLVGRGDGIRVATGDAGLRDSTAATAAVGVAANRTHAQIIQPVRIAFHRYGVKECGVLRGRHVALRRSNTRS